MTLKVDSLLKLTIVEKVMKKGFQKMPMRRVTPDITFNNAKSLIMKTADYVKLRPRDKTQIIQV